MLELLKIAHLLALVGAMGMTTATLIALRHVATLEAEKRPAIAPLQEMFGKIGVSSLALLWITGFALFALKYKAGDLGGWFTVKIVAVMVLTGLVMTARRAAARARATGVPPALAQMRNVMLAAWCTAFAVIVFAVLTFG